MIEKIIIKYALSDEKKTFSCSAFLGRRRFLTVTTHIFLIVCRKNKNFFFLHFDLQKIENVDPTRADVITNQLAYNHRIEHCSHNRSRKKPLSFDTKKRHGQIRYDVMKFVLVFKIALFNNIKKKTRGTYPVVAPVGPSRTVRIMRRSSRGFFVFLQRFFFLISFRRNCIFDAAGDLRD